jgi:TolB-like protein
MSGSVRKSASLIRVTVHLVDARTGAQLWTETYDREPEAADIYAVQDDLTDRIVASVADETGVLARSMFQAVRGRPLESATARELMVRCAVTETQAAGGDRAALRAALETYVGRHPDDADIWAEIARMYMTEHATSFDTLPNPLQRALAAASRAIEIDPRHQRGWVMFGWASFFLRDEVGLEDAVERAIKANPRDSSALAMMGNVLTHKGEYDRGHRLAGRAMDLNPAHPGWHHFASFNCHFARREFAEALRAARRVNLPGFFWMPLSIAAAAGHLGLAADGKAAITALFELAPALADDKTLREFFTRWYWDANLVDSLLEGVRRSKTLATAPVESGRGPASAGMAAAGAWIAVIPFAASRGDDLSRALADGLTSNVTAGLSRFSYLKVVAAQSARQHKGTVADVQQLGHALGARYILDGGVRRSGSALRIAARLIDTSTGAPLWSGTYQRDAGGPDATTVQHEVTDQIVGTVADVHGVLLGSMSQGLTERSLDRLGPAEVMLRSWSYQRQPGSSEHAALRARLEQIVDEHPPAPGFEGSKVPGFEGSKVRGFKAGDPPAFALLWAALAHLYLQEYGLGFNSRPEPLGRARRAVDRALELDALQQHAWEARMLTGFFERDRERFAQAMERTLALNPQNASVMALAGILLVHAGDLDRGCALADRAMVLNSDHPGWYHLARAHRDYAVADDEGALREARRLDLPELVWAELLAAMAAGQLGRAVEATAALAAVLALAPSFADEEVVREASRRWKWNDADTERQVDGYRKAMALREAALH